MFFGIFVKKADYDAVVAENIMLERDLKRLVQYRDDLKKDLEFANDKNIELNERVQKYLSRSGGFSRSANMYKKQRDQLQKELDALKAKKGKRK